MAFETARDSVRKFKSKALHFKVGYGIYFHSISNVFDDTVIRCMSSRKLNNNELSFYS